MRFWSRRGLVYAIALLLLITTACSGDDESGADGGELQQVDIGLSSGSLAVFMYYVADTLGYYEEEGLDATVTPTEGSSDAAQQLAAGNFDVAQGASSAMLAIMGGDVPLHPFYSVITREYRDLVVPADSSISSVADLDGATIGVSDLAGGEVPIVRFILTESGIDPKTDVDIVASGEEPPSVASALEQERIQAYSGSRSALIPIEAAGGELRSIFPESLESGPVEALVASDEAAQDQDLLTKIGRATAKGTAFCAADVEACLDVIGQDHPELVTDRETAIQIVETFVELSLPPEEDGRPFYGPVDLEGWQLHLEIFSSGDDPLIPNPDLIDLEELVVDGLQNGINDFDIEEIEDQANNYEG